jgi:aspartate aminotransferase
MLDALEDIDGVRVFKPKGTFYIWAELEQSVFDRLGCRSADELSGWLAASGIGSAPGDAFGQSCENAIRFAFSCETSMVEEGAIVLRSMLKGNTLAQLEALAETEGAR